jgi:hypothetical protein
MFTTSVTYLPPSDINKDLMLQQPAASTWWWITLQCWWSGNLESPLSHRPESFQCFLYTRTPTTPRTVSCTWNTLPQKPLADCHRDGSGLQLTERTMRSRSNCPTDSAKRGHTMRQQNRTITNFQSGNHCEFQYLQHRMTNFENEINHICADAEAL